VLIPLRRVRHKGPPSMALRYLLPAAGQQIMGCHGKPQ